MVIERPIGFWVKLLDRLLSEQFAVSLEEHGLTRRQWQLLTVLQQGPGAADELDRQVAPFLDDQESSVEHLDELLESEWVSKEAEVYQLTERGGTSFTRVRDVVLHADHVAEGISEDEYRTTVTMLERMARNLGWDDE